MAEINNSIKQLLTGDKAAFSEIYNQTIHTVYRTLYFLTENKHDLDDIVQDVYVELFKSLDKFDQTRSFQPWLYGITMKHHQSYRRKKWRKHRNEAEELKINATAQELDFSNLIVDKIANQSLIADMDALSYKLKQIIVLHYINDLKQDEVSEILQIPIGTVKSRIHLALKQLRKNIRRETNV